MRLSTSIRASVFWVALFFTHENSSAQFLDDFTGSEVTTDRTALRGWAFFSGDGNVAIELRRGGDGYASIFVDAANDKRNVWWALIHRRVSEKMDLSLLAQPGFEFRIETRIRVSHAPRRVNLQVLTQRTIDYHSHLMEYDIPDSKNWHTISMTTRDFDARPGDTVLGHLALIDWGLEKYRVDLDYVKVDIVNVATVGPDLGEAVPYHPPLPDPKRFSQTVKVSHDSTIDNENTDINLNDWGGRDGDKPINLIAVDGARFAIMRWDLSKFTGKKVAGHGLLELTTYSVLRKATPLKDFGLIRVVEILGGDPNWDQTTVTADSFRGGQPLTRVLNSQMIIDWPVTEGDRGKTLLTISKPVLQRMIDGRTLGLAIMPLGALTASFYSMESEEGRYSARLYFELQ